MNREQHAMQLYELSWVGTGQYILLFSFCCSPYLPKISSEEMALLYNKQEN
jgi:hypothetical protein